MIDKSHDIVYTIPVKGGMKMPYTEAVRRAQKKYDAESVTVMKMRLNYNTDADVIEWLNKVPNKSAYVKELIRKDMRGGK